MKSAATRRSSPSKFECSNESDGGQITSSTVGPMRLQHGEHLVNEDCARHFICTGSKMLWQDGTGWKVEADSSGRDVTGRLNKNLCCAFLS
ncbi:hypothetical protein HN011_008620 [Eciton burchellii]|nr:hypothetical protein HN011_008620 [Eciton burchellii]